MMFGASVGSGDEDAFSEDETPEDDEGDSLGGGAPVERRSRGTVAAGTGLFGAAVSKAAQRDDKPPVQTEEVIGRLDSLRVINDWAVGQIWNEERSRMKITGKDLAQLQEGLEYTFVGFTKEHPTHGTSLEVVAATPYISPSITSISQFIAKCFPRISLVRADRYVKSVRELEGVEGLERLRSALTVDPSSVDLSALGADAVFKPLNPENAGDTGMGRKSAVFRDLATRIGTLQGVRSTLFKPLAAWLVGLNGPYEGSTVPSDLTQRCWSMLSKDPYSAIRDVEGYGWSMAEAIGRFANVPRDDKNRLCALVKHALDLACDFGGHTYVDEAALSQSILRIDPRVDVAAAIGEALERKFIVQDEQNRIYPPKLYQAEKRLASNLAELLIPTRPMLRGTREEIEARIKEKAEQLGFTRGLDPSQLSSVANILTSSTRIHTLTGGPGCGKTTVMEVLAAMLPHKEITFGTPTGMAAKVLSSRLQRLNMGASTLQSVLGADGDGSYFHGPDEPLDGDFLIIDESTMPDLELMDAAVAAMPAGMQLLLLGDPQQLPSIGAGRVLRDILEIPEVDHNRLAKTHRNSGDLLAVIESCGRGDLQIADSENVTFSHTLGEASKQFKEVASNYIESVRAHGYENVILLMSRKQGETGEAGWNTTYANAVLREMCNPGGKKIQGTALHVNDRILITKNMMVPQRPVDGAEGREERVVNGDKGTIVGFSMADPRLSSGLRSSITPEYLELQLDDGRVITFPGRLAPSTLTHSYALTVHSGQGSEFKKVILVATPGLPNFINQNMLFTGLSRSRQYLHVFANDPELVKIAATPCPHRNSALIERTRAAMEACEMADLGRERAE